MAELFVKQAKAYASSRPTYPASLFSFLASLTPSHSLAWDVGTGNGQAAVGVLAFSPYSSMMRIVLMLGISLFSECVVRLKVLLCYGRHK